MAHVEWSRERRWFWRTALREHARSGMRAGEFCAGSPNGSGEGAAPRPEHQAGLVPGDESIPSPGSRPGMMITVLAWRRTGSRRGLEADARLHHRDGRRGAEDPERVRARGEPDLSRARLAAPPALGRRTQDPGGDRQAAREEGARRGGDHRDARHDPGLVAQARRAEVRRVEEVEGAGPTAGAAGGRGPDPEVRPREPLVGLRPDRRGARERGTRGQPPDRREHPEAPRPAASARAQEGNDLEGVHRRPHGRAGRDGLPQRGGVDLEGAGDLLRALLHEARDSGRAGRGHHGASGRAVDEPDRAEPDHGRLGIPDRRPLPDPRSGRQVLRRLQVDHRRRGHRDAGAPRAFPESQFLCRKMGKKRQGGVHVQAHLLRRGLAASRHLGVRRALPPGAQPPVDGEQAPGGEG